MSLDADDEILQDFIVEASEILELLSEQLVDLEQAPDDFDLLNAVFRGFHTIKGGAGFLNIDNLVEICHRAEDVFNILRQGQRPVDAQLMDVVLEVLDVLNAMFDDIRAAVDPEPASRELIQRLDELAVPVGESAEPETRAPAQAEAPAAPDPEPATAGDEALDELLGQVADGKAEPLVGGDDISEEEFESLLDELHGKGRFTPDAVSAPAADAPPEKPPAAPASDDISEDEFESLLDEMHGKGKPPGVAATAAEAVAASTPAEAAPAAPLETPAPVVAETPKAAPPPKPAASAKTPPREPSAPRPKTSAAETTVRVDTKRLDDIMNMVGELVLVRNRLATLRASVEDEKVLNAIANLDVVTSDLQLSVMKTRMQPIKKVFGRFPRVIRDLARSLDKEIDLEMIGEDTDLDKNLVESLADPLVHLVRNAVDHGIEKPDEREAVGKPRVGKVVLSAAQEGDHILLSIRDDGKGMDPDVLRRKAVEKGMMDAESAERLDNRDCYNLIFQPGFSTKSEISDVSGRGVGMDVVKTRISELNGTVEIDSEKGKGSLIVVKLPLTLAILPTLMVVLGDQPFALPLASVVEIFNLRDSRTNVVDGQLTVRVRDRAVPLFHLRKWLINAYDAGDGGGHVVVVNMNGMQIGLVVDTLLGQEEVVIKPLGASLQSVEGMAGATITGDGKIALILDVPGLMRRYASRY